MLALLLALGGTVHVDGGLTSSSSDVVLPDPPAWATHVRLRVEHDTHYRFGHEVDGDGVTTWAAASVIRTGWTLRAAGVPAVASRCQASAVAGGVCIPWDSLLDFAGDSGGSEYQDRHTTGEVTVPVGQPLTLGTRAISAWSIVVNGPGEPGPFYGLVWWLNETSWSADVHYEWVP